MCRRSGMRFRDLLTQGSVNMLNPFARVRKLRLKLEILRHLIADQVSVDYEKGSRQKHLARPVVAVQDVLG